MTTINIKAHTDDDSQIEVIKAVIKALKIKFSISKSIENEIPYNKEFVAKIKKGQQDIDEGKGIVMSISEFKNLCK